MALSGPQQNLMIEALKGYDRPALTILLNQLDRKLEDIAGTTVNRVEVAVAVTKNAGDERWDVELARAGFGDKPADPSWAELHSQLAKAGALVPAGDEFEADLIGLRPFIMRDDLRKYLRALESALRRVLIVRGERYSGKSYTKDFIVHLSETRGFVPYWIELATDEDNQARKQISAADIIGQIALALSKLGQPPETVATKLTDGKWSDAAREYALWLRGKLETNPQRWIILDGFDHCDLVLGAPELIGELARRVSSDLSSVRLVLLGYEGPMPAPAFEDDIDEPSLGRPAAGAVVEFIGRLYARANPPPAAGDLEQLVADDAFADLNGVAMEPKSMRVIGERLAARAEKILL